MLSPPRDDRGGVTVEAAFAIAALITVAVLGVGGLAAVSMQVRCVDAAREAVRLAARGDERAAVESARRTGPDGASVEVQRDGARIVARVRAPAPLLPGVMVEAEAVAVPEPGA
ncbi:TadE family type IV pilus minor pilin [Mycolicibacterium sp. CBMA 226]|uniref:TadE family type IV pilus minor pilin n=1 Tax=Mycolicibacterium sp. CBMA 226 TaxID=2606611 RepID=UPI0013082179|nr:TadE family type IV pilus minor pilin [Mycolicibacterium sp. CBMA 226]MUL79722.1 pilus assembly protein TadE [Mycolicibacterium sp. CBMA 226]